MSDESFLKSLCLETAALNPYSTFSTFPSSFCVYSLRYELKGSLLLGIYEDDSFCGIAEMYGYKEKIHKISVGFRLPERCWGRGIASRALGLMVDYIYSKTDIEIIQASSLPENHGSARVLEKNGFSLVVQGSDEDWGYDHPLPTDKWIR